MKTGKYQLDLIERLSFVRYGGTDEETRAAKILMDEITAAGGSGEYMEFQIPAYDVSKCALTVTAPFEREITAVPFGRCGEINEELKLYYAERGVEEDYAGMDDMTGYAVMIDQFNIDAYMLLCKKHASAFITINGKWYDERPTGDLYTRSLRDKYQEFGKIPGFMITARDAMEIVRDGAEKVHLELSETEFENTSRNVLAVIPGTEKPGESIVLTAHYDSVLIGTGSWDNATGSANLMALYKYFLAHPAKRTLRFIWCGSEEQGLLGSKAYIAQHEDLIKEIKFCFNFDMCGTILGNNKVFVTGGDDLKTFAEQYCREVGWSAKMLCIVHSSDSAPFCDRGIPALGLSRGTPSAEIHTHHDLLPTLSAEKMGDMLTFSSGMISRVANSVVMPIGVGMPDNMKTELDKYFQRDKKAE